MICVALASAGAVVCLVLFFWRFAEDFDADGFIDGCEQRFCLLAIP